MNKNATLTIRTEALRDFLTFHLDRADEAAWAMERKPGSSSPEGINAHLNAVNDAARDLQFHLACVTGVLNHFGINRQGTPDCRLDIGELRNKVRRFFEDDVRY